MVRFDDPTKIFLLVVLVLGWFASYVGCSCTLDDSLMLAQHAAPKKKRKKKKKQTPTPTSNRNQTKVTTTTMTNNNNNNNTNTMDPPETIMMEDRNDLPHTGTATGGMVYRRIKKLPVLTTVRHEFMLILILLLVVMVAVVCVFLLSVSVVLMILLLLLLTMFRSIRGNTREGKD